MQATAVGSEPIVFGQPRDAEGAAVATADLVQRLGAGSLDATISRLRGAFALVLPTVDGATLLATDRFATQPLHWRVVNGQLHVADRADTLGNLEPKAAVDTQAVFDYLHFHAIPSPRTIFEGVFRLPAAHALRWRAGRAELSRYWTPTFAEPSQADLTSLGDEFRALLQQAVVRQLAIDPRPACYLSGGTDSSTVAGLLARHAGAPVDAYSIGFEAEGYDEMAYARIAASHFAVRHHAYYVTPTDLVTSMPRVAAWFDQPFGNSSAVPAYHCALQASGDGVRRILAGDGGDELFGGNARYAKQRLFGLYSRVPRAMRGRLLEPLLGSPLGQLPGLSKARSYVEQARVPMPDRLEIYNLLQRVGAGTVLAPAALARMDEEAPLAQQRASWREAHCQTELNRTLAFDWRYTLAESDLPKVTGSAGLAGLQVGFPLLDEDLLDFSMRLPVHFKLRGGQLRWFFKESLKGFLPDAILTKRKHGFGLPFGHWTVQHASLRALAQDALGGLSARGLVREDFTRSLISDLLPRHPGYYGEMVWILTMLELWLRAHRPGARWQ